MLLKNTRQLDSREPIFTNQCSKQRHAHGQHSLVIFARTLCSVRYLTQWVSIWQFVAANSAFVGTVEGSCSFGTGMGPSHNIPRHDGFNRYTHFYDATPFNRTHNITPHPDHKVTASTV